MSYGKPYLVGENGPELFVPGMSGRIEPNDKLRRLTSDGASAVASSSGYTTNNGGPISVTNHWTISGVTDPRAVADIAERRFGEMMARLERDQRGLLSD